MCPCDRFANQSCLCFDRSVPGSVGLSGACPVRFVFFSVCQLYFANVLFVSCLSPVNSLRNFFLFLHRCWFPRHFGTCPRNCQIEAKRYRLDRLDERLSRGDRVADILAGEEGETVPTSEVCARQIIFGVFPSTSAKDSWFKRNCAEYGGPAC